MDKRHRFAAAPLTTSSQIGNQSARRLYFPCWLRRMQPMHGKQPLNIEPKRRSWDWARNASPGVRDAHPLPDTAQFWRVIDAGRDHRDGASLMFGAFLYVARGLLVPILSALIVSLTLRPAHRARRALRIADMGFDIAYRSVFVAGFYALIVTCRIRLPTCLGARRKSARPSAKNSASWIARSLHCATCSPRSLEVQDFL